jgi:hypothetical protein
VPNFADGVAWSAQRIPTAVNLDEILRVLLNMFISKMFPFFNDSSKPRDEKIKKKFDLFLSFTSRGKFFFPCQRRYEWK